MRPSDITDGVISGSHPYQDTTHPRFNEAVGYYRRSRLSVAFAALAAHVLQ